MEIEPAICPGIIFSDLAIREQGTGKTSIIGSFTHFNAQQFPFLTGHFVITALLTNIKGPVERLPITARIEAADSGHVVGSVSGQIGIGPEHTKDDTFEVSLPFTPTTFFTAGAYNVVILVNNEELNRRKLLVRPVSGNAA